MVEVVVASSDNLPDYQMHWLHPEDINQVAIFAILTEDSSGVRKFQTEPKVECPGLADLPGIFSGAKPPRTMQTRMPTSLDLWISIKNK